MFQIISLFLFIKPRNGGLMVSVSASHVVGPRPKRPTTKTIIKWYKLPLSLIIMGRSLAVQLDCVKARSYNRFRNRDNGSRARSRDKTPRVDNQYPFARAIWGTGSLYRRFEVRAH